MNERKWRFYARQHRATALSLCPREAPNHYCAAENVPALPYSVIGAARQLVVFVQPQGLDPGMVLEMAAGIKSQISASTDLASELLQGILLIRPRDRMARLPE